MENEHEGRLSGIAELIAEQLRKKAAISPDDIIDACYEAVPGDMPSECGDELIGRVKRLLSSILPANLRSFTSRIASAQ